MVVHFYWFSGTAWESSAVATTDGIYWDQAVYHARMAYLFPPLYMNAATAAELSTLCGCPVLMPVEEY